MSSRDGLEVRGGRGMTINQKTIWQSLLTLAGLGAFYCIGLAPERGSGPALPMPVKAALLVAAFENPVAPVGKTPVQPAIENKPIVPASVPTENPYFATVPPTLLKAGETWLYHPQAKTKRGTAAVLKLEKGPPGMELDGHNELRWMPPRDFSGQAQVFLLAGDPKTGLFARQEFLLGTPTLFKVSSFGDYPLVVRPLENGTLLGLSSARLMLLNGNMQDVTSSYWAPSGIPRALLYYQGYVYLNDERQGLGIFDVRDGRNIKPIRRLAARNRYGNACAIQDDLLISASYKDYSVYIYSLEQPDNPELLSRCFLGTSKTPNSVAVLDHIAYVVGRDFYTSIDLSDPKQPKLQEVRALKSRDATAALLLLPQQLFLLGAQRQQFSLNPFELEHTSELKRFPGMLSAQKESRIFLSDGEDACEISLSAAQPELVRKVYKSSQGRFAVGPEGIYQTLLDGRVLPVPEPPGNAFPDEKSNGLQTVFEVLASEGQRAYVAGSSLDILDLSNPQQPQVLGHVPFQRPASTCRPILTQGLLFLGNGVWDVRNPSTPKLVQPWPREVHMKAQAFDPETQELYLVHGRTLECWRVGVNELHWLHEWELNASIETLAVKQGRLYAGALDKIYTYRIATPRLEPLDEQSVTKTETARACDLQLDGELLYAALGLAGVVKFNLKNPDKPELLNTYKTKGTAISVLPHGPFCYVAETTGIKVLDLRTPGEAQLVTQYPTTDCTTSLAVVGGLLLSAEHRAGVQVLACDALVPPDQPLPWKPQAEPLPVPTATHTAPKPDAPPAPKFNPPTIKSEPEALEF